jgi:hypothetical protein
MEPTAKPRKTPVSKRKRSRLYAHWLDGEWHKVASPVAAGSHGRSLASIAEGGLKLHALFGTKIAISDVQLTDSPVMAELFSKSEFRYYLRGNRNFLTLVTNVREDAGHEGFARATNGLYRAQNPGWTTSLPVDDVAVIRRFAGALFEQEDKILERFSEDPALQDFFRDSSWGPALVIQNNPRYRRILEGVLHGICHFSLEQGGPWDLPQKNDRSYLNVIEDALEAGGGGDTYGELEQIYTSVDHIAKQTGSRYARSAVNSFLQKAEPDRSRWTPTQKRVWQSVVHAWNSNVSDTVGASESIAPLPDAVFPTRGKITDTTTGPFKEENGSISAALQSGKTELERYRGCRRRAADSKGAIGPA